MKPLRITWLISATIMIVGAACSPDRTGELDDIREATFRHQFLRNASGLQQHADVYFLALRDPKNRQRLDPSEDLLCRFQNHHPRVAKVSSARTSGTDGVLDKTTGERGLIFIIGQIHWHTRDRVDVDGGYYEAGESSSGNTYHLRKRDGKWVVEKTTTHWISCLEAATPSSTGLLAASMTAGQRIPNKLAAKRHKASNATSRVAIAPMGTRERRAEPWIFCASLRQ